MLTMNPIRARAFLVFMAIMAAMVGYGFGDPATVETLWPGLWAPACYATACVTLSYACRLRNSFLFYLSGVSAPVICCARVSAILSNQDAGVYTSPRRFWIALGYTGLIGVPWATIWVFILGPLHGWKRQSS